MILAHAAGLSGTMHSGFLLLLWLLGVALVQFLPGNALAGVALGCGLLAYFLAGSRVSRLLRRTRFLLLAIFVLFAWFTPGEAVLVAWPHVSPTHEGLRLAAEHLARLFTVVSSVAVLLDQLAPERLVGGLRALCRPLGWVGLPADRVAVRLLLVLRYVEFSSEDGLVDWRVWLLGEGPVAAPERLHLAVEQLGLREVVFGAFVLGGCLLWWTLA